ncbi:MAG TPA: UDP-N-acetylmuramoyl-L-alanyl-D-glutamate--2,6-diaminopimelate ligase [Candidatus Merdivicinus intestinigallinarum]|nr:UDP-N-acetylmuramoyl-L-alanyl-D-glutamate--2,6-diaminopimelate ligase [Candidatus Merdivicinus intestinigallinarum]
MKLSELLANIETSGPIEDREIRNMTCDSRQVGQGDVFVCIAGGTADGHDFARKALEQGAAAVVCQRDLGIPGQILTPDTRKAYSRMAANFYGNPSKKLRLIGVTGTKGKSTVATLIKAVLMAAGKKVGLIGTIQNEIGDKIIPADKTTPDALELESLYADMVKEGCEYCVMEVSSHALDQNRIGDSHYEVAVFTNLSHEHLDYHKTMENYFEAKAKLFSICDTAVINADDPYGQRLLSQCACPALAFSMKEGRAGLRAFDVQHHPDSVDFRFCYEGVEGKLKFAMPGDFSVRNALAAMGACLQLGVCLDTITGALRTVAGVRGRNEIIPTGRDFTVICDYAHSPDSIENILSSLKETVHGRLVALFGCGGDRDRTKRPLMGAAAAAYADFVYVTSDNPRTEDPEAIIQEILPGVEGRGVPYAVIPDRREAIFQAIRDAKPGDTIVLCGKGHEDYQVIGHEKRHFDEREIVAEALAALN